ncbi:MAG TPA: hypothetical protein VIJ08_01965, partial [Acidimicrobiales bacterium]
MARVSKYPDSSGNPVSGLTGGGGDGLSGPGASHGPSEHHHPVGKVGSGFLWLLGRRRTPMPPATEPAPAPEHQHADKDEHDHEHEHNHEHGDGHEHHHDHGDE